MSGRREGKVRGPRFRKLTERAKGSLRNVRYGQLVRHARLEILEDAGLSSRHADRQRLAVCHAKLDDIGAVALRAEDHDTVLAAYRRFFLLHSSSLFALHGRRVGQALAPKAIAERLRSGGVWEAESNVDLLDLVPTPAAANRDA